MTIKSLKGFDSKNRSAGNFSSPVAYHDQISNGIFNLICLGDQFHGRHDNSHVDENFFSLMRICSQQFSYEFPIL